MNNTLDGGPMQILRCGVCEEGEYHTHEKECDGLGDAKCSIDGHLYDDEYVYEL
jgi:hypothetical protein